MKFSNTALTIAMIGSSSALGFSSSDHDKSKLLSSASIMQDSTSLDSNYKYKMKSSDANQIPKGYLRKRTPPRKLKNSDSIIKMEEDNVLPSPTKEIVFDNKLFEKCDPTKDDDDIGILGKCSSPGEVCISVEDNHATVGDVMVEILANEEYFSSTGTSGLCLPIGYFDDYNNTMNSSSVAQDSSTYEEYHRNQDQDRQLTIIDREAYCFITCPERPRIKQNRIGSQSLVERCLNGVGEPCPYDGPIGCWDTSGVTNMDNAFYAAYDFNEPLRCWDVSGVTSMNNMFYYALNFNQNINEWQVGNVNDMSDMFIFAQAFDQPLDDWNVSKVGTMNQMFSAAYAFNQDINGWDTSSVTDINSMFLYAYDFNHPLSDWNVSSVIGMEGVFRFSGFNQPIDDWDVTSVTNMSLMMYAAADFSQCLATWPKKTSNNATTRKMMKDSGCPLETTTPRSTDDTWCQGPSEGCFEPTASPTMMPTDIPTSNPTEVPTVKSTPKKKKCKNSRKWIYTTPKGRRKRCPWVQFGNSVKKCNFNSTQGKKIHHRCKKACGVYAGVGACAHLFEG